MIDQSTGVEANSPPRTSVHNKDILRVWWGLTITYNPWAISNLLTLMGARAQGYKFRRPFWVDV